jgi:1-hydroxy-2-naphthoate dioxygenase
MSLEELNRLMQEKHLRGYWSREEAQAYGPSVSMLPFLWKWADIEPVLEGAAKYVDIEHAFRRNIGLDNPTGRCKTINMGMQLILPHEKARAHRHTAEAIRFVIEGSGKVWSTVEGEALVMEPGDLILTPNWTWHDHVNDSSERVIWVDGLNAAIAGYLQLSFREDYPTPQQPVESPADFSRHASALARASWLRPSASMPGVPYRYPWSETEKNLNVLKNTPGDPCDGIFLRYVNPWHGGPTLPFISCAIQLLTSGMKTKAHRHTSVSYYHVVRGGGATRAEEMDIQWDKRDFFVVPPWSWHHHENQGSEDAILFSMSDEAFLRPLGLYREEVEGEKVRRERKYWFGE